MKKKLYKVSRWNTKVWINHVENSEKQNVVILVDLLSNHNYDTYCIPWMDVYFIIKETLLVNHNDISGGFFIKFSFLLGISTHTPDRYVY